MSDAFLKPLLRGKRFEGHAIPLEFLGDIDVPARLEELSALKDGWLDGEGKAPLRSDCAWLASRFNAAYPEELQLPYIYPTPVGGVRAEWSLGPNEASLEIDVGTHSAEWHELNVGDNRERSHSLALDQDAAWRWLGERIRELGGAT